VTLLFAHGGGFCKETWEPIIRRIRESPLLSTAAIECVTFDFKYHGGRRDETVVPVIDRSNPASMRVQHPAQDLVSWISADAWEQVRAERAKSQTQAPLESQHELIGIGHSMGAVALWKTEVEHPGTFDGLVLFEPGYGGTFSRGEAVKDFVVSVALEREKSWYDFVPSSSRFIITLSMSILLGRRGRLQLCISSSSKTIASGTERCLLHTCVEHLSMKLMGPSRCSATRTSKHRYTATSSSFSRTSSLRDRVQGALHFGERTKMFIPETFTSSWPNSHPSTRYTLQWQARHI